MLFCTVRQRKKEEEEDEDDRHCMGSRAGEKLQRNSSEAWDGKIWTSLLHRKERSLFRRDLLPDSPRNTHRERKRVEKRKESSRIG